MQLSQYRGCEWGVSSSKEMAGSVYFPGEQESQLGFCFALLLEQSNYVLYLVQGIFQYARPTMCKASSKVSDLGESESLE